MANERWRGRIWRRCLGDGEEVMVVRMRRQKSSGEGGGRVWSRGKRRTVRGGTDVAN